MSQYNLAKGDLEMLALGLIPLENQQSMFSEINSNEQLKAEYRLIEEALFDLAKENEIQVPNSVERQIKKSLFRKTNVAFFGKAFNNKVFRIAASILLVGSVLVNFYFLRKNSSKAIGVDLESKSEFLVNLPFESEMFEQMFGYLETELSERPCEMDFRVTKEFLEKHSLNTPKNLSFLAEHNGHCDCEVLMNISQLFPGSEYHHGDKLPNILVHGVSLMHHKPFKSMLAFSTTENIH